MKLFNLILEPLEERYTEQWYRWSNKEFEKHFDEVIVPLGETLTGEITVGKVLDANGTIYWKGFQMAAIARLFHKGEVKDGDVFFLHDLQYPGWEAIKYMAELNGVRVKVFGFLHASSWTTGDFAEPMAPWLAPYELAWINAADGVFVGSMYHKNKIVAARNLPDELAEKIHVVGNPIDVEEYIRRANYKFSPEKGEPLTVIWPHRFHKEKNPKFAVEVLEWMIKSNMDRYPRACNINWVFSTPKDIHSPDNILLMDRINDLDDVVSCEFGSVRFKKWETKDEYYQELARSTVVWSTSLEESFGYCNVEGIALGCHPVLPNCASHSEIVRWRDRYLYKPNDIEDCARVLMEAIEKPSPPKSYIEIYEESFERMANVMKGEKNDEF